MALPVELEVRPESGGSVIPIPLSSTGSDGKARIWAVRDQKNVSLLAVDTQVPVVKCGVALQLLEVTNTTRDVLVPTPANGMVVYNSQLGLLEVYLGGSWLTLATN